MGGTRAAALRRRFAELGEMLKAADETKPKTAAEVRAAEAEAKAAMKPRDEEEDGGSWTG